MKDDRTENNIGSIIIKDNLDDIKVKLLLAQIEQLENNQAHLSNLLDVNDENLKLKKRIKELEKKAEENCLIIGKSGTRESELIMRIKELEKK